MKMVGATRDAEAEAEAAGLNATAEGGGGGAGGGSSRERSGSMNTRSYGSTGITEVSVKSTFIFLYAVFQELSIGCLLVHRTVWERRPNVHQTSEVEGRARERFIMLSGRSRRTRGSG